ncbi:vWA domain-containing protein [Myceligenerans crystallogenes]|uniref:VWFA domain-containing protein n=1 Tax=Myceligenerans crystallogenes TaxID=316335 RepID=A0ABP4ZK52_9MICO
MSQQQQDTGRRAGIVGGVGALAVAGVGIVQEALLSGVQAWVVVVVLLLALVSVGADAWVRWWPGRTRVDPGLPAPRRAAVLIDRQAGGVAGYGFLAEGRLVVTTQSIVHRALGQDGDGDATGATVVIHWESALQKDYDAEVVAWRDSGAAGIAVLCLDQAESVPKGAARLAAGALSASKQVTVEVRNAVGKVTRVSGAAVQVHSGGHTRQTWSIQSETGAGSAAGLGAGEIDGAPVVREADKRIVGYVVDTSGDDILFAPLKNNPAYDEALAAARTGTLDEIAGRRSLVGWLPAVAGVVAVLFLGYVTLGNGSLFAPPVAPCEGERIDINITVGTEKDALIETLADRFAETYRYDEVRCVRPHVSGVSSGLAKTAAAEGWATPPEDELHPGSAAPQPDLWLPTSSVWAELLVQEGHDAMLAPAWKTEMITVTSSVLGILMTEEKRAENFADGPPTWQELALAAASDDGLTLAIDDPVNSTSGMANSVAVNEAFSDVPGPQKVNTLRAAVASVPDALAGREITQMMNRMHEQPELLRQMDAIVAQEQTAFLFNCRSPLGEPPLDCANPRTDPAERLVVVQPADRTYAFDHPAILMKNAYESDGDPKEKFAAVTAFAEFLAGPAGQEEFERWGFRPASDPAGVTDRLVDVVGATAPVSVSPWPVAEKIAGYQAQWQSVRLPVRVHLTIDNSGSMTDSTSRVNVPGFVDPCDGEATDDPNYLQLAQKAALDAVERLDDGRDAVSLDAFPRPDGWQAVPMTRLDGGVRGELREAICDVDGLGGSTPLYSAIEGAERTMIAEVREEGASSSTAIVVLSDGAQQPPADLRALLKKIRGETIVPVISVAIGPGAPIDDLYAIRDATGGAVRDLRSPDAVADLDTVLVDVFGGLTGE